MNKLSFYGTESSGSVAKRDFTRQNVVQQVQPIPESMPDTVSFKGREEKNTSVLTKGLTLIAAAGLAFAGLAYAHKANLVDKLSDGKFKDFMRKSDAITKPCHDMCHKIKTFFAKKS